MIKMIHDNAQSSNGKKIKVEGMFNAIAPHYDFLNHLLSFGTDYFWRYRAIRVISENIQPEKILDVATGTGDLAIASLRLKPVKITGIDISEAMLELGRKKILKKKLQDKIELRRGDSEAIDFPDASFDVAMSAFGVRNFEDTLKGLSEICRVLRKGGMIMVLEFSRPSWFPFRQIYNWYFKCVLPWLGQHVSGDSDAYTYLPDSVMSFPENRDFMELLCKAGFTGCEQKRLSGGIASIYYAFKQ